MRIEEKVNNGRLFLTVFDSNLSNKKFEQDNKQLIIPEGKEESLEEIQNKIKFAELIHFIGNEATKFQDIEIQTVQDIPHGFIIKF